MATAAVNTCGIWLPPPNFDIINDLAERMGVGEYFDKTMDQCIEAVLSSKHPSCKGVTLEMLKSKGVLMQPRLKEVYRKKQCIEAMEQELKNFTFVPDLAETLTRLTPQNIIFNSLILDKQKHLTIQGHAKIHADINELQTRLIATKDFYDVDLKFVTKRKIANMPVMDFKIVSRLNLGDRNALWYDD